MTFEMFDPELGRRPMQAPVAEGKGSPKEYKKEPKNLHIYRRNERVENNHTRKTDPGIFFH